MTDVSEIREVLSQYTVALERASSYEGRQELANKLAKLFFWWLAIFPLLAMAVYLLQFDDLWLVFALLATVSFTMACVLKYLHKKFSNISKQAYRDASILKDKLNLLLES